MPYKTGNETGKETQYAPKRDLKPYLAKLSQTLKRAAAERAQMTLDDHLERLRILSEGAEHQGQFAAAITAETNRAAS